MPGFCPRQFLLDFLGVGPDISIKKKKKFLGSSSV